MLQDSAVVVAAILGAGSGVFGKTLIEQLFQLFTGKSGRKRTEIDRAMEQRDAAFRSRNIWVENFRKISNYSLKLNKLAVAASCIEESDIPEYPDVVYDSEQPNPPSSPNSIVE